MKRIILIVVFLIGGAMISLSEPTNSLSRRLWSHLYTHAYNAGVEGHNRSIPLTLEKTVYNKINGSEATYHADFNCKAYALDEHWYILAGTCGNSVHDRIGSEGPTGHFRYQVSISDQDGKPLVYAQNNHLLLLHEEKFIPGLYINVLATSSPLQLFLLTAGEHTAVINTSRFGLNKVFTRELKPKTVRGNFFSLLEGPFDLSGTATDPLFLIASNKDVFLSAYNDAPLIYHFYDHPSQVRRVPLSNAKNSHRWFILTKEDLQFIKKTMIKDYPKDWKRIKKRLFLDQTQTPYFK